MIRKRIASISLAATSAVATTVVGMTWPTLDLTIGVSILAICTVVALIAIGLWLWPEKQRRTDPLEGLGRTVLNPRLHPEYVAEQARQRAIDEAEKRRQSQKLQAALGFSFADGLEKFAKDREAREEADRQRMISEASQSKSPRWVPLHKALQYLVYETEWSENQASPLDESEFNHIVSDEFLEMLARGEIKARGKRGWDDKTKERRTTEAIPADWWTNSFMMPHSLIVLADDNSGTVGKPNQGGYRYVIVDQRDVERIWKRRNNGDNPTSRSSFCEPLRQKIEAERKGLEQ